LFSHSLSQQVAHEAFDLSERFASLIGLDQRLIVDLDDGFLLDDLDQRRGRYTSADAPESLPRPSPHQVTSE
jgi:hypothetical protein